MTTRPPLARSIPFWVLLVGSVATTAVGAWLVVTIILGLLLWWRRRGATS